MLGVTRAVENRLRDYLRVEHDTTLPRFDVLAALYRQTEPINMSQLSRLLLVSKGNATTVVDRLEKDGMARRVASTTDRRAVHVRLTPKGRRAFEAYAAGHEREVDAVLASLTEEELDCLRSIFRKLRGSVV